MCVFVEFLKAANRSLKRSEIDKTKDEPVKKKALLIGCNYPNAPRQIDKLLCAMGPEIKTMKTMISSSFPFDESGESLKILALDSDAGFNRPATTKEILKV